MKQRIEPKEVAPINPNVTMEGQFQIWWKMVRPSNWTILDETSHRNAYFAGAAEAAFIVLQLADEVQEGDNDGGAIVERLMGEIKDYFEDSIGKLEKKNGS